MTNKEFVALEGDKILKSEVYEEVKVILPVVERMPELPIFHTKNLEAGKTYKGLINGVVFKVIDKVTQTSYYGNNHYRTREVFVIQDESGKTYEISPYLRLYIQEVTK